MELTLKNFRCHVDRKIKIPETGLINISGDSGDGKTTILMAIVYALYGKIPGKARKPYSHGSNTCKVILKYKTLGLKVTRTSKPNSLILQYTGETYEGDAAQSIIIDALGMTYDEFLAGAYVIQRSNASVLSMTPTEQVKFIEVLASTNAEDTKQNIKKKKKQINDELLRSQGEYETMNEMYENAQNDLGEEPDIPKEIEDGINPEDVREEIKKYSAEMKQLEKSLDTVKERLEKAQSIEKEVKLIENKILAIKNKIDANRIAIKNTELKSDEEIQLKKKELIKITNLVKLAQKISNARKERDNFEEAYKEYKKSAKEAKLKLKNDLLDDNQIKDLENLISNEKAYKEEYMIKRAAHQHLLKKKEDARKDIQSIFERILAKGFDIQKIKKPGAMIESLEKIKKDILSANPYECPCCENKLILCGEKLEKVTEGTKKASPSKHKIGDLDNLIQDLKDASEDLNVKISDFEMKEPEDILKLEKRLMKVRKIKEEYDKFNSEELPPVLMNMKSKIEEQKRILSLELSKYECTEEECLSNLPRYEENLVEIKEVIRDHEKNKKLVEMIISDEKHFEKQISALERELPQFRKDENVKELEKKISNHTKKVLKINGKISKLREILDNVKEYEEYQKSITVIAKLKKRLRATKKEFLDKQKLLEGYLGLEDVCKEAEILALEGMVASINEHAKIYLDYFFEDPILVRLECVKEVKSKKTLKLQMNTVVENKGNTYSDIEELSGGERQRCDMAFLLAVSDILGGKILMLDECLNNLDASINSEVLGLVRDLCANDKMILVVSHEAVKGLFTDVVNAKEDL